MTHALLFNRSCTRLSAHQPSTATAWSFSKSLGQIQNLDPDHLMSGLKSKTTPGETLPARPQAMLRYFVSRRTIATATPETGKAIRDLRAPDPTRHSDRTRRHHHGSDELLRGKAVKRPQRPHRPLRRVGLVHRSWLGIEGNYEGDKAVKKLPRYVFRVDAHTGEGLPVITEMDRPNGTCFSPDESRLYVVDIGHIRMFDMYGVAKNVAAFLRSLGACRVVLFGSLVTGSYPAGFL